METMTSLTLPKRVWKEARQQLQADRSLQITVDNVLSKFESIGSRDAALNAITHLKKYFGLIDDRGKLTKLGELWVDDDTYPRACQLIIDSVMPSESLKFLDNNELSTSEKAAQLQQYGKFGEAGAKKTVRFYLMLAEDAKPGICSSEIALSSDRNPQGDSAPKIAPLATETTNPPVRAATERTIHVTFDSAFPAEKIPSRLKAICAAFPEANFELTIKA